MPSLHILLFNGYLSENMIFGNFSCVPSFLIQLLIDFTFLSLYQQKAEIGGNKSSDPQRIINFFLLLVILVAFWPTMLN